MTRLLASLPALLLLAAPALADDPAVPLFNGRDLTGWVNVNCHPDTFLVKNGEIITTGRPTGFLRTARQYENFVLEFDWMHVNTREVGNSGLFVWGDPLPGVGTPYTRGIEVQVLVNLEYRDKKTNAVTASSHGDVFSIHGATCKPDRPHPLGWARCLPSENRAKGGGEWNHYKVTANNGVIKLEVNGKEVSGVSDCRPRKGYLALESEGAECHFRNLLIRELPSTNPKPEETASVDQGHRNLFTGLDLAGWTADDGAWKAAGGVLRAGDRKPITSTANYGPCELVFDWKQKELTDWNVTVGDKGKGQAMFDMRGDGNIAVHWRQTGQTGKGTVGPNRAAKAGAWNRTVVTVTRSEISVRINGEQVLTTPAREVSGPIAFRPTPGLELMNVFARELK